VPIRSREIVQDVAEVFEPLEEPARYKGIHGGRGSAKSNYAGEYVVEQHLEHRGFRTLCAREIQKSLKESAKTLIEAKLTKFGLGERDGFKIYNDVISTPGDGLILFQGLRDHTAESIKSIEGLNLAWLEEAQTISKTSLTMLRPTVRAEGSTILATWNPRMPEDAVDELLRGPGRPANSIVVRANWNNNPWFPRVLDEERLEDLKNRPTLYPHVWDGEYATVLEGAYYAADLIRALDEDRVTYVPREPLNKVYAFFDLASTSDKADSVAIGIVQFIGQEIRFLNYRETLGQAFSSHVHWLRESGYADAFCVLPHDGTKHDTVYDATPQGFLQRAGFGCEVIPNQGTGAAMLRVGALREVFHRLFFHCGMADPRDPNGRIPDPTKPLRTALGWYHSKRHEKLRIDLGPEHDWSSHAADMAGLVGVWVQTHPTGHRIRPPGTSAGKGRRVSGMAA
jgi:phage terminase large subunit